MAQVSFLIATGAPTSPPPYDPRDGEGISFYADTASAHLWIGLGKTGDVTWGRFNSTSSSNAGSAVGVFNRDFPIVTTSNNAPDFPPQAIPADGRLHFHISYPDYSVYVGLSSSSWSIYGIAETT